MELAATLTIVAMLAEMRFSLHRVLRRVAKLEDGVKSDDDSGSMRPAVLKISGGD